MWRDEDWNEADNRQTMRLCVTNVTGLLLMCFVVIFTHKLMFSGLLLKDLFKGGWSLAEKLFKQNYCHACHTRFAVFFPLPSCYVSSLITAHNAPREAIWLVDRYFAGKKIKTLSHGSLLLCLQETCSWGLNETTLFYRTQNAFQSGYSNR